MAVKSAWYYRLASRIILLFLLAAAVGPVYLVVSNSFRKTLDISTMPPQLFFTPILRTTSACCRWTTSAATS